MILQLPLHDATLRFAIPFPSLSAPLRYTATVGLAVAFIWLLSTITRRERQQLSRRLSWSLFALRLLAFLLLAVLLIGDPTLTRTRDEEVPGRVLIAVDVSDSMRVTDPNRPIPEKLRLARLLKLATDIASDDELETWALNAASVPRFASSAERDRFDQVQARVDNTPRIELCRRLLSRLIEPLKEKHTVDLVSFCPEIATLPTDATRLQKALTIVPVEGKPMVCTDLKLPLTLAGDGASEDRGAKLLGVILLTDGRHNWGASPILKAQDLGTRGVPIDSIAIGPREAPADVAVVSARAAAATVFKGSSVPVEVSVRVSGWPAGPITVSLTNSDGKSKPLTESIPHTGKDAIYYLNFKTLLDEPGPQRLIVKADAGPNDRFPENNTRSVRVNVVKDRARVMLIDGESRWEFHYLQTCLGRDPKMDVRSIVFRQPRLGKVREDDLRASGIPAKAFPQDPDALASYDVVVLGDVEPEQMTREQWQRVEKYVAESGGTLVLSAGKRAMPLGYSDHSLNRLLPFRNAKVIESLDGFPLVFTPAGERTWFLSMDDTPGASRAVWDRMPWHGWGITGDLKDGAEVIATGPGGAPIIARQNFGFGRVLFLGIDSTWRWRFKAGDLYHHRFWGQIAQWAASDRLLPVTNAGGTIRFGPREPVYLGGQDVEVVVRAAESVKMLSPNARKAARIVRLPVAAGGPETQTTLAPLVTPEGRPRDLQAKLTDLTPGKYAVELDIPEWADELVGPPGVDGRAEKLRAYFEVVPPDNEELIDLSANWTLLQEMADASNGQVVTPENVQAILEKLSTRTATRSVIIERPLRRSWSVFGMLLGILAVEWILRKWIGLP